MTASRVNALSVPKFLLQLSFLFVIAEPVVAVDPAAGPLLAFRPVTSFSGSSCCAIDTTSYTLLIVDDIVGIPAGVPGPVQCAHYCKSLNATGGCAGFNYLKQSSVRQCRFYNTAPNDCFTTTSGCAYYEVRRCQYCTVLKACRSSLLYLTCCCNTCKF